MADQIIPWCYYGYGREPLYAIGVARDLAEQKDDSGQPLIGGKPVERETIGPPPEGFRPQRVTVWNPQTKKKRQVPVFSMTAPLLRTEGKPVVIQVREKGRPATPRIGATPAGATPPTKATRTSAGWRATWPSRRIARACR